jgi:hypothetical protein
MRPAIGEWLMSAAALGVVGLTMMAVDDRVREQVALRLGTDPSVQLSTAGAHVRNLATVMLEALHDQSSEHAPLLIFVLAAIVLVLVMLRT